MSTTSAVAAGVRCSVVSVAGTAPCTRRTRCSAGTCAVHVSDVDGRFVAEHVTAL
ncbi:MAG: hypothetical protein M3P31_02810 [Actinomycetota bacterium]|nr:hypothetical protein [Actinomycetota bacterium]